MHDGASESARRPRWWLQLFIWIGFSFGIYLLFTGDTVEQLFGAVFVSSGLLMGGAFGWALWRVLREKHRTKGRGDDGSPDDISTTN